jgi:hypothetical protein
MHGFNRVLALLLPACALAAAAAPPPAGKSIFDDDWKPPPTSTPPAPPTSAPAAPAPPTRIRPRAPVPAPVEPGKGETVPPAAPPVPSAAAIAPAERLIKETFKAEYARGAAVDKAALAKALLQEVPQNLADAPALYVLLREARDLATAAGDVESAVNAARGLRDAFSMDAAAAK